MTPERWHLIESLYQFALICRRATDWRTSSTHARPTRRLRRKF